MSEFVAFLGALRVFAVKLFSTAKARRTRREKVMNQTKEEIEETAELAVDAMLKVYRTL
jgi:hypothetical protein